MRGRKTPLLLRLDCAFLVVVLCTAVFSGAWGAVPPQVVPGATQAVPSSVNRFGSNTTLLSAEFQDADQPGIDTIRVTFAIREPDDLTERVLVIEGQHGSGNVTIVDLGAGLYRAEFSFDPVSNQSLGFYDLFFEVSDGVDTATDSYDDNPDELEVVEELPNNPPLVAAGATHAIPSSVNRHGVNETLVSCSFADFDDPGTGAFEVTFKIREPNDATEVVLADEQPDGSGGVSITRLGAGTYRAELLYDPPASQTLGAYDLFFEVSDGADAGSDDFTDNPDELTIYEQSVNGPPQIVPGATTASPGSVDRFGTASTQLRVAFADADQPGNAAFRVTLKLREPYNAAVHVAAEALQNGQNGMSISDDGGGNYTARIEYDPPDDAVVGDYDLYCMISDGTDEGEDPFESNLDELAVTHGGENAAPVVPADNTFATPAAVERVGANPTILSATFTDADDPGTGAFAVTFKLRFPDDVSEEILADDLGDGIGGVSIIANGGAVYTASVGWDPPAIQDVGTYDLYFHVSDGIDTAYDRFENNLDELEVYDAISNRSPSIVSGSTLALPSSLTRIGSGFTMIQAAFSDDDVPGRGAFLVTIRVRDAATNAYTIVNDATDGQQGLRVRHVSGSGYEASVLWDPPVGQVTGPYDLYFSVEDNRGAVATDDFANNPDELTITATAILGDGYLLHRTNDADNCGGPNAACHNMENHQGQDCLVCHTPHQTQNIYLVREVIDTPNSGARPVLFKTLGIGDPYNDPDPVIGDPNSGAMADDTDGAFTGVCEVCHTTTSHHRNDGGHQPPAHYNAEDCSSCHQHAGGFASGESSGGDACSCHSDIFDPMSNGSGNYHHTMLSDEADYATSAGTCLLCHVDHDIFRPDLNPGVGTRAKNLRSDIDIAVVPGDNGVLLDSDYRSTGTGGICLSCHVGNCDACHDMHTPEPVPAYEHVFIVKAEFDAATTTHNYEVTSTYPGDGSTFKANCVKCHNDNMTKSYQNSTYEFGTHDSDYSKILAPLGIGTPTDPLEEEFCFQCHSMTSNPNAGSNLDFYGVQGMTNQESLEIEGAFSRTYAHPTRTYSGRHTMSEGPGDLADGNRHAECSDCHSPHAALQGTHDGSSNLVSNALKGVWGVEPTSWPAAPDPTDNGNVFAAPPGFTKLTTALKEYQICLKCHSNYTTLPSGVRNLAEEINPNYPSTHGIVQESANPYCDSWTMNEPWGTSGVTYCSDCHRSSNAGDPEGPHGSNLEHLLVATITSSNQAGTPLCYVCHKQSVYWTSSDDAEWSGFRSHPSRKFAHKSGNHKGCFACHMWDYARLDGFGVQTVDDINAGEIFIHGQNKKWVYSEQVGGAGSGQPAGGFLNGYCANVDYQTRLCESETCHFHDANWDIGENR